MRFSGKLGGAGLLLNELGLGSMVPRVEAEKARLASGLQQMLDQLRSTNLLPFSAQESDRKPIDPTEDPKLIGPADIDHWSVAGTSSRDIEHESQQVSKKHVNSSNGRGLF